MSFNPWIPDAKFLKTADQYTKKEDMFDGLEFKLIWRQSIVNVKLMTNSAKFKLEPLNFWGTCKEEKIIFKGKEYVLQPKKELEIKY